MRETIQKDLFVPFPSARELQTQLTNKVKELIDDNYQAIKEINALADKDVIINRMKSITTTYFPDADPSELITGGIMAYTEETYRSFIEQTSTDMLRTIGTQMLVAKHDQYMLQGNDFLKEQKLHTPLADYHFTIDALDLTLSSSSKDSVDIAHKTSLIPYMTHRTLKTVEEVEKDEVGLAGFKDTIQPFYIKQLTHGVHKEIDNDFVTTMTDDFIPEHHFKWVNDIQAVLHGL